MTHVIKYNEHDFSQMGFLAHEDQFGTLWQCPEDFGRGYIRLMNITQGLKVLIRDFSPDVPLRLDFRENALPVIYSFLQRGNIHNKLRLGCRSREFLFCAGQTSVSTFPEAVGQSTFPAGHRMRMINIWTDKNFLNSLFDKHSTSQPVPHTYKENPLHIDRMTHAMEAALHDLCNCPYHGAVRKVFLECKCMELICHHQGAMLQTESDSSLSRHMPPDEVERIHHARELLLSNLQDPPSVADLARMVGMNDYKLRQGFHRQFGTTIFEQLRLQRLNQARSLLQNQGISVAEAAFRVGYSDMKHFYKAFKKHFNTTPGACRQ